MARTTISTLMASSLILGASMAGCSGAAMQTRVSAAPADTTRMAALVEKSLANKDFVRALAGAEALVAANPRDGSFRTLLGRAYLANGRYASAQTAFEDAMTLGQSDPRTIVSLAMVQTGLGRSDAARDLLSAQITNLPAADYGLGMAIAGDPKEGVRALLEAVQQPEATAKTRQNLAYALALSGDWVQARLVAGHDLDALAVQDRITSWARTAQTGAEPQRVAALVGIAPSSKDGGLPARLALNALPDAAPTALASSSSSDRFDAYIPRANDDTAVVDQTAPVYTAAIVTIAEPAARPAVKTPANQIVTPATVAMPATSAVPMIAAPRAPFRRAVAQPAMPVISKAAFTAVAADSASKWVVQLGAFDSRDIAIAGWQQIKRSNPTVDTFGAVHSTITVKGRLFHRLALTGFAERGVADNLCASIKRGGGVCFVRADDGAKPLNVGSYWASQRQKELKALASNSGGATRALR